MTPNDRPPASSSGRKPSFRYVASPVLLAALAAFLHLSPTPAFAQPVASAQNESAPARQATGGRAQPQKTVQTETPAPDVQLAEKLIDLAQTAVSLAPNDPARLRASQLLTEAAFRLSPRDARMGRLAAETATQVGDDASALDIVTKLARLDPSDRIVQQQLVSLYAQTKKTTEDRIAYLTDIAQKPSVPEEVRAHAAYMAARTHLDRGQTSRAIALLAQGLKYNPLHPETAELLHRLQSASGTPFEQARGLLAVLRASPLSPWASADLAQLLSSVGLAKESLYWFDIALALHQRSGMAPSADFLRDYASRLFVSGDADGAKLLTDSLLGFDPADTDAALLKLVLLKSAGSADELATFAKDTRTKLLNQLGENVTDATLPAAIEKARANSGDAAVAAVLSEIAYIDLYFAKNAAQARPFVLALSSLLSPTDPTVVRLEGWLLMAEGKNDQAMIKLSAVSDRDPLARLGVVRLMLDDPTADAAAAATLARDLLSNNPSGLLSAVLHEALGNRGYETLLTPSAEAIRGELGQFPEPLLSLIDKPQDFYAIRAEPLNVVVRFGQPMLARVTLTNTSKFDLSVGPLGAIRPDLWMDANIRGSLARSFPATSFDRLSGSTILRPRQSITQIVRLDRGVLGDTLKASPEVTVPVFGSIMTSPVRLGDNVVPGPGGYVVQFNRLFERAGQKVGTDEARAKFEASIATPPAQGAPDHRVNLMIIAGNLLRTLSAMNNPQVQPAIDQMLGIMKEAAKSPEDSIRASALGELASCGIPAESSQAVKAMLADKAWQTRMLLIMVQPEGTDQALLQPLQSDPDSLVARTAALSSQLAALRPSATPPSPAPAPAATPASAPPQP